MLSRYVVSQVKHNSYFLVGLALGLWVSLAVIPLDEEPTVACQSPAVGLPVEDEYEPHREERLLGPAGQTVGRSIQRPRYYSNELGMRASLLTGVLSSEEALKSQIAALNHTTALLQPALKFFITASAMSSVPGLANVVGFTDTREILKPFHALKYLADNYLEEYEFFFLVTDTAFVNARRLTELVSQLSVSEDVYMGTVAEDDSHYCSLEGGVLLSNSVLRAVHSELDWCVRNSYSPHHHENIGRCVLHAAHLSCTNTLQGESYSSVRAEASGPALVQELADAVTVRGVGARHLYALHAFVARLHLQRDRARTAALRAALWRSAPRHPPGYRNATWPGGLRLDPALRPPPPDTRFDHLRWTSFNATHAFYPDDHREVAPLGGAHREALALVLRGAEAWALRRWRHAERAELLEGALRWEPASALRYRLLLRLRGAEGAGGSGGAGGSLRLVEAVRPLGAVRLVPVRYVTESARVLLVLGLDAAAPAQVRDALAFLQRYETVCLDQDKNTALLTVIINEANATSAAASVRDTLAALGARHAHAQLDVVQGAGAGGAGAGVAGAGGAGEPRGAGVLRAQAAALEAARARAAPDALLLLLVPHAEFGQDFLNRVRMNTIPGAQWYLPLPFARYSLYAHPRFVSPGGGKPATNTGRFNPRARLVAAFYRADLDAALAGAPPGASAVEALARSPLHCVRAPEPALVLSPRAAPCEAGAGACWRRAAGEALDLGARHSLAQLLLEYAAEREA